MLINAFILLAPFEVPLVQIQLFLCFPGGMFWEE